jgi:anti-sigma factor RsiW
MDSRDNNIKGEHVLELVSPYIDNALDAADRERVRAHIDSCETCAAEYRELQATQQMLRALPVQVPPRVFTLTEEMVGVKVGSEARPSLLSRLFGKATAPRLATGSVLAFALLLVVLVSDLGVLGGPRSAPDMAFRTENGSSQDAPVSQFAAGATTTTGMAAESPTDTVPAAMAAADQTATPGNESGDATSGAGSYDQANAAPTTTALLNMGRATTTNEAEATGEVQAAIPPPVPSALPADQAMPFAADGTPSPGTDAMFRLNTPSLAGTDEKQIAEPTGSGGGSFPVTLAIEIALALLGVALAVGATLARRRRV